MNNAGFGFLFGCIFNIALWSLWAVPELNDTAYTKGITDCRSGKVSYTVTFGPEGVDTTYTYNQ
jgi:hypothetical protein